MQLTDKSNYCGSYLGLALVASVSVWAIIALTYAAI